jgi:hypothetical protein
MRARDIRATVPVEKTPPGPSASLKSTQPQLRSLCPTDAALSITKQAIITLRKDIQ